MDDKDIPFEDFLAHYGVKGMRWGVRSGADRAPNTSRKINKEAAKDAEELARSKMFFGEGAGTRRKLIKASTEAKAKKSEEYSKALEYHVSKQDMSTHSEKAKKERSSIDRKDRNKKRVSALARQITKEHGTQAALVALTIGGAAYLTSPNARNFMNKNINSVKEYTKSKQNIHKINKILNLGN